MNRKEFLKTIGLGAAAVCGGVSILDEVYPEVHSVGVMVAELRGTHSIGRPYNRQELFDWVEDTDYSLVEELIKRLEA